MWHGLRHRDERSAQLRDVWRRLSAWLRMRQRHVFNFVSEWQRGVRQPLHEYHQRQPELRSVRREVRRGHRLRERRLLDHMSNRADGV